MEQQADRRAVGSVRVWESAVALVFLVFAAGVMWDSWRIGARWAEDGPQAGYFPFYIGVFIAISALVILYTALRMSPEEGGTPFVEWGQLKMVLTIMIPSVIYVALIENTWFSLGIYLTSVLFIAAFMRFLGKYGWLKIAAVSVGVVIAFFLMFEVWFQVPLPKGPLEAAFGFA
jgi:putative tricarboxylic transport membrane protein